MLCEHGLQIRAIGLVYTVGDIVTNTETWKQAKHDARQERLYRENPELLYTKIEAFEPCNNCFEND